MADHSTPTDQPRDTYGTGYGCACPCRDARACIVLRYGEEADGEPCTCLCHQWNDDEDGDGHP